MNNSITIGVVKKDSGSKVISLSSYQQLYDLVVNSKLIPNTWYRFPYRSVNFLNGWRNANNNTEILIDGYEARAVHTSDEEILLVQAISSFQISKTAYSEQFPQDVIEFQPYTNKLGVGAEIFNGSTLSNETEVSNFDLQFDGTNVFFQMPAGYPALFGHYFYLYAEFQNLIPNPPTGGEILLITEPVVTLPTEHSTEMLGSLSGASDILKLNQGSLGIPQEVEITTNGNGKDARFTVNAYGSSPNINLQLIPVEVSGIYCVGNGYAVGDEIYFTFDGENYTYTLTGSNVTNNTATYNITDTTTSGIGTGVEFLARVFLFNGEGLDPSSLTLALTNTGQLYQNEEEITISGTSFGLLSPENDAVVTILDTTNISSVPTIEDYYQDGCFEPLTPNVCTCQFPYTSDEPSFGYGKAMSRIRVEENGMKVVLLDLTEEDYNNYIESTLYVETIEAITDAYGWIVKRTDKEKNISLPLDFRNRKYRRWNATFDNANLGLTPDYYFTPCNLVNEVTLAGFKDLKVIDNELSDTPESMNMTCSNGAIGGADANWYFGYIDNFVFLGRATNSYLGRRIENATFGRYFNNNHFEEDILDFYAGISFYSNKIKSISQSISGDGAYNNDFKDVSNCMLGSGFVENHFACHIGGRDFTMVAIVKNQFAKNYQFNSGYQIVRNYIDSSNELVTETI